MIPVRKIQLSSLGREGSGAHNLMRMDTQSNTNNDCIDMYLMRMDTRIHEYREMSKGMICIPQSNTNND